MRNSEVNPPAIAWAGAASAGAALIHLGRLSEYWHESWMQGIIFATLAALQLSWTYSLLRENSPKLLSAVAINSTAVAVWVFDRTIGVFDTVATSGGSVELTEIGALVLESVACVLAWWYHQAHQPRTLDYPIASVALACGMVVSLGGAAISGGLEYWETPGGDSNSIALPPSPDHLHHGPYDSSKQPLEKNPSVGKIPLPTGIPLPTHVKTPNEGKQIGHMQQQVPGQSPRQQVPGQSPQQQVPGQSPQQQVPGQSPQQQVPGQSEKRQSSGKSPQQQSPSESEERQSSGNSEERQSSGNSEERQSIDKQGGKVN